MKFDHYQMLEAFQQADTAKACANLTRPFLSKHSRSVHRDSSYQFSWVQDSYLGWARILYLVADNRLL
jgi:hypothetical protein